MSFRASFRTLLLALIGLASMPAVHAQPERAKVVLYKDRLAAQFDTVDCVKNLVKINPLLFFRGEIPIYFEHAITPMLSIEVGLGVTLRDYMAITFTGDDADDYGAGTEIVPNLSYHIGARFYFMADLEPVGWYLHPEFVHLEYAKDIRAIGPDGGFTDETFRDERTFNDLRLLFGYQTLGSSTNWVVDMYGGVGLRSKNEVIVNETLDLNTDTYTYKVTENTENVPAFFLGIKLGIGF